MIIVDMNQVMISNIMKQIGNHTNMVFEEDLVRHMVLNSLRSYRQKFVREYGELVLCFDNKGSWRRDVYPYYKANRKKDRDKSEINWQRLFEIMNTIRSELETYFPYKIILSEKAEADDIIGTLCNEYGTLLNNSSSESILILSGDKDFIQLQKYANVKQYNPVLKKFIIHNNPESYLKEHILIGDRSDGIPNALSPDDCFVMNKRQKVLTQKRKDLYLNSEEIHDDIKYGWKRNEMLIDLTFTPAKIQKEILNKYNDNNLNDRSKLFGYFVEYKLKNLLNSIGDF